MQAIDSSVRRGFTWMLAFAVLAAIAAVGIGWGTSSMAAPDAGGAQAAAQPVASPITPTLLPDYQIDGGLGARRETVERPAFVPTRRPAPAPVQDAPKAKMPKGQFTLTGTAIVDQKHIAFLRETAGGKSRSVRAGETINGVVVAEVKADRVRLALGDESEELLLKVAHGPRQTIQPPQPGAPAPGAPVPPRPPVPGQPIAADTGAPVDSDATILERRRAARAALQAQQEAARAGGQPVAQTTAPAAEALAIPQPAAAQPAAAATPPKPDPGWNEVYRRMQQPRR